MFDFHWSWNRLIASARVRCSYCRNIPHPPEGGADLPQVRGRKTFTVTSFVRPAGAYGSKHASSTFSQTRIGPIDSWMVLFSHHSWCKLISLLLWYSVFCLIFSCTALFSSCSELSAPPEWDELYPPARHPQVAVCCCPVSLSLIILIFFSLSCLYLLLSLNSFNPIYTPFF